MSFPTFVILVVVAVVFILLITSGSPNRRGQQGPQRACANCGATHPHFAQFCRRCGKRLS